jgi:hypothetical protein
MPFSTDIHKTSVEMNSFVVKDDTFGYSIQSTEGMKVVIVQSDFGSNLIEENFKRSIQMNENRTTTLLPCSISCPTDEDIFHGVMIVDCLKKVKPS